MNKFRKFLIGMLVAASAVCVGGAVACNGDDSGQNAPAYYKLDLDGRGFDIVFEGALAEVDEDGKDFIFSGGVKAGVEVRFKVQPGVNTVGNPIVKVNGTTLAPDSDKVYSFVMERDTEISVTGLNTLHTMKLTSIKETTNDDGQKIREERRIKFYDEDGKELKSEKTYDEYGNLLSEEMRVEAGEDFKFALWTSPYYTDGFTVKCGYEVLESDGVVPGTNLKLYTVSGVASDGEIDVIELEQQLSFANHDDPVTYGDGTEANPYKISKAIDLFYMSAMIKDQFNSSRFSSCYYELQNDIDLDGEQLYVIGDASESWSVFNGHFNGNGHTISNFYITDLTYDEETSDPKYLPYVGLFGYVSAFVQPDYSIRTATIKDLTLKDFTVDAHPGEAEDSSTVGSLVGFGVGVEISGCRAEDGDITVINDDNQLVMVGGLVGRLQGAYVAATNLTSTASAFVRSSSTDVSVRGTGSPRSAGGVVGYLISADESAIAYVMNSYSEGSVTGAMHSGGIVGTLGRFSTVVGSYSTANVSAKNTLDGLNISPEFKCAYAGGIAGYAEECAVIYGCYAANDNRLSADAEANNPALTGAFAGGYAVANAKAADLTNYIEYNNSTSVTGHPASVFQGLGWSDDDWDFSGGLPALKNADGARTVKIVAQMKDNAATKFETNLSGVAPMSYWYVNGLDEYVQGSGTLRSWGYYFDEAMEKRVPFGFVPFTAETTLYFGYADYSEVAGNYYLEETPYSNGGYIKLTADGNAELRNGGLYHACSYAYDGEKIVIYRSALAALSFSDAEINGGHFAYGGSVNANGVLTLEASLTLLNPEYNENNAATTSQYVNQEAALSALKEVEFACGEYQDANGVTYLFRKNGTGIMTNGNVRRAFTFLPAGTSFNITLDRQVEVTVSGGAITSIGGVDIQLKDKFSGSWQADANSFTVFTFDGLGAAKMSVVGQTAKEGTYTFVKDNEIKITIDGTDYKGTLNSDGNVVIEGVTYYVSDGFTGKWFMVTGDEWIEVTLGGTGTEGYGIATIDYAGGEPRSFEAQYDVMNVDGGSYLRVFVGDVQYGALEYNGDRSADGYFYSLSRDKFETFTFYLYDGVRGVWTGVNDDFDSVTFNGRSASAEDCEVVVNTAGNAVKRGKYTLNGNTGTMTVGGKEYALSYSEEENKVTLGRVSDGGTLSEQLARRDEWYQIKLYEGETVYEFDGKSNVGGHVKVRENGAVTETLEYTLNGSTVSIDGVALTPGANGYSWKGKTLKFKSGFVGDWIVSGTDKLLTIAEVGGTLEAAVTCTGVSGTYNFSYSLTDKTLTLTEGEIVTVIKLMNASEMSISRRTATKTYNYNSAKEETADAYKGLYEGEDGTWLLDGLGNCRYGSGGAVFTPTSGDSVKYTYKINTLGIPYIRGAENVLFVEAEDGEEGYVKGGVTYKTVAVNAYYDRTVFDYDSETRATYLFDGISTVWLKEGNDYTAAYKYEIVTATRCELIALDTGVRKNATMEQVGLNIRIKIEAQKTATAGEGANAVTYALGVATLWKINADGSYEKAFGMTATEKANEYLLTDGEGNKYNAILKEGEEGNTLEIKPVKATEQA